MAFSSRTSRPNIECEFGTAHGRDLLTLFVIFPFASLAMVRTCLIATLKLAINEPCVERWLYLGLLKFSNTLTILTLELQDQQYYDVQKYRSS